MGLETIEATLELCYLPWELCPSEGSAAVIEHDRKPRVRLCIK